MTKYLPLLFVACFTISESRCQNKSATEKPWAKTKLLFEDTGTQDWNEKWMLDGQQAKVINTKRGMELIAGSDHGNDSSHMVLWTKQSFQGDISIEYDYTRTDTTTRCVNILYFLATGKGGTDHPKDIALWNDKRKVASMRTYFNNMHTYHISYAAFAAREYSGNNDYIRLRRYNPDKKGLANTDVPGDHFRTGLFKPGITYHIQVVKYKDQIEMHIQNTQNATESLSLNWNVSEFSNCESGRIGLRHMYTRNARYKNIKVWALD